MGASSAPGRSGLPPAVWVVALAVLVAFLLWVFTK
jgi:hypothetical protein